MTSTKEKKTSRFSWWWVAIVGLFIITVLVQLSEIQHRFYQADLPYIYGDISLEVRSISNDPPYEVELDYKVKKVLADSMILVAPGSDSIRRPLAQKQYSKVILYDFPGLYSVQVFANDSNILQKDVLVSSRGWAASVQHDYAVKAKYVPLILDQGMQMAQEGLYELRKPNFSGTYWFVDDLNGSSDLAIDMDLYWNEVEEGCKKIRVVIYGTKGFLTIPYADQQCKDDDMLLLNGKSVPFDYSSLDVERDRINLQVNLQENSGLIKLANQSIFEGTIETMGDIIGLSVTTNQVLTIEKLDIESSDEGLQAAIL